jgi:hypothetical protein
MATFNGVGTMFYGWRYEDHSTATVTEWFVVAFFPVIPLKRCRIRLEPQTTARGAFAFGYQVVEQLPLSFSSIITTLYKAYLIVPALFALPIIFYRYFHDAFAVAGPHRDTFATIGGVLLFLYYPVVLCLILDRASGRSRPPADDSLPSSTTTPPDGDMNPSGSPAPAEGLRTQSSEHYKF